MQVRVGQGKLESRVQSPPRWKCGGLEVKGEAQAAELGWMSSPRWGREGSRGPALRLSQRQVLGRSSGGQ